MNKKAIAYILLKNFNSYEKLIDNIDNNVRSKATQSHITTYAYGANYQSIESVTKSILELIEKKRQIINCRLLVLDNLNKLPAKKAEILKLKFFERKTFEQIGEKMECAATQARRELVKGFKSFYTTLITDETFDEICNSDFSFYKPLKIDYLQSIESDKLSKMGMI